jgi:methionyl-tRNA formyltransferase
MAKQLYSPVSILNNINTAEGINKLKQTKPDLIICIRYGLILKNAAISIPCFGVINLHSGLLPRYRGVMATFWAMLNGDTTIGCTLHYIDNHQIDTGRTIASTKLSVYKKRSYLWHVFTLYEKGILEIAKTVQNIKAEQVITCKAQREGGHYYTFPKADDFQNFVNKGFMLASEAEILALFKTRH